jgi:hypothetical protein
MIIELLNRFDPGADELLGEISKHIDDEMLRCIASADYGKDQQQHLVALRQVRETGTFPREMYWYPAEVLELIRWSSPENPDHKPGATGLLGHWTRAFCCAALLRATREPYNYGDGVSTNQSLINLILSLRILPVNFTPQAVKFLAWLLLQCGPEGQDEQICPYAIGLLWFALQLSTPVADEMLISLAQWIVRKADEQTAERTSRGQWALRMGVDEPPPSAWEVLGNALFDLDLSSRSQELREWVRLIALELTG